MSKQVGLIVRFTLTPGHEESFDRLVEETLIKIHAHEPGTLAYISHAVPGAANQRVFYELYRDRAAFEAHEGQPHVRRFLDHRNEHVTRVDVDLLSPVSSIDAVQEGELRTDVR